VGKAQRQSATFKKKRSRGYLGWLVVAVVVGAAGYGLSQMSSVAFDEDDIKVVNFQGLSNRQKQEALEAANEARCTCGCSLGLAQCVSTDLTCPIRESNVERIKGMVRTALTSPAE
jgi:hypothetical protein